MPNCHEGIGDEDDRMHRGAILARSTAMADERPPGTSVGPNAPSAEVPDTGRTVDLRLRQCNRLHFMMRHMLRIVKACVLYATLKSEDKPVKTGLELYSG